MRRARRREVAGGIAVVAAALLACRSQPKTEPLATLDEPVRIEWSLDTSTRWSGGRIPGPITTRVSTIVVKRDPETRVRASCHAPEPELAADGSGRRIAYRCKPDDDWKLVYLGARSSRSMEHCRPVLGKAATPKWDAAKPFEAVAADVARCPDRAHVVFDEVREALGHQKLAELLVATQDLPRKLASRRRPDGGSSFGDDWDLALESLDPAERPRVVTALRTTLATQDAPPVALWRALKNISPDEGKELADALAARAREIIGTKWKPWSLEHHVLRVLLARLALLTHGDAAKLACAAAAKPWANVGAHEPLAHLGAKCEAIAARIALLPCSDFYDCSGAKEPARLCTREELAAEIEKKLEDAARGRGLSPGHGPKEYYRHNGRALIAAALAQGPLPEPALKAAKRRAYAIDQEGPPCTLSKKPGRCTCFPERRDAARAVCGVQPDATEGRSAFCTFRIDDAKQTIVVLESTRVRPTPAASSSGGG